MLGDLSQRLRPRAEMIVVIGQIGLLADDADQHAAFQPALADARVEHRGFAARVRADDDDGIGLVDARDGRVEKIGRAAEFRIQLRAVLAAIDVGRAELSDEVLEREHLLDGREVADNRSDPIRRRSLDPGRDRRKGLAPACGCELAVGAHVSAIEALGFEPVDYVTRLVVSSHFPSSVRLYPILFIDSSV